MMLRPHPARGPAAPASLSVATKAGYAVGDVGLNLYWQGANYYLLYFYTDVIGFSPLIAGAIITIGGVVDALSDPIMGVMTDRFRGRGFRQGGGYGLYLAVGAAPLGLAFFLAFSAPAAVHGGAAVAAALATILLFRLAYTLVSVPYAALGARITENARERSVLSGFRMYGGFLGGLAIILIATAFTNRLPPSAGFAAAAGSAGILGAVAIFITFSVVKDVPQATRRKGEAVAWRAAPAMLLRNKAFLILTAAVACFTVGAVFVQSILLIRFERFFPGRGAGDMALLAMAAAPVVGIPFWSAFAVRFGKRAGWFWASSAMIAGLAALAVGDAAPLAVSLVACAVVGAAVSGLAVLQWALLPDTVEYGEFHTGRRLDGATFGVAIAVQKLSAAVTALLAGAMLSLTAAHAGGVAAGPFPEWTIAAPPIMAIAAGLFIMQFYPLTEERHGRLVSALRRRAPKDAG